ncbi:MAG: sulfur carrier protein ThiS [Treponema sp.]|nr:sulfur carrier protein ThiS [Treponema sp.]
MTITANGKSVELSGEISVTRMLEELKVSDPLYVTVQLDEELVPRADFDTLMVREGAAVEFLYYMGGGTAEKGQTPC